MAKAVGITDIFTAAHIAVHKNIVIFLYSFRNLITFTWEKQSMCMKLL